MPTHPTIPTFEQISAGLPSFDAIAAGLPAFEDFSAEMVFPADVPAFDAKSDPEVDANIRLADDRTFAHTPTARTFRDYRGHPAAFKLMSELPRPGVSHHGVLSGRFALWELVPALIAQTGQDIAELTIATLSFSAQNAADLLTLIDAGKVKRVGLLISYFFKAQNRHLYDSLIPQLRERGHPVLAMRTHAKLTLAHMADGTKYVIESSANLRSSDNVEQFVITRDDGLYQFHHDWIHGELLHGKELGKD
jgi:hypothetical protein